jgi:hypothetical protein
MPCAYLYRARTVSHWSFLVIFWGCLPTEVILRREALSLDWVHIPNLRTTPLFSILLLFPLVVICQWQLSHHDGYSSFQQQVVMFNTMSIVISSTQYPLFNHWSFSHGNEFTDPHINITSIPLVFILSMANLAS